MPFQFSTIVNTRILLLFAATSLGAFAQDQENMAAGAAADLQKATDELTALRLQVEGERSTLVRRISELEQLLINRRAELAKTQRFQENQLVELNALKADSKRQSDEIKYI
jgi:hypothetical protein